VLSTTQLCIFVLCLIHKKQQHEVKDIRMFNLIADPKNKKEDKTVRWIKFKPHGRPPSARAAGSATKIADHLVLFFGGYCSEDGDGTYYNDAHVFNLSKFLVDKNSRSLPHSPNLGRDQRVG
jgi:hypothetical protein